MIPRLLKDFTDVGPVTLSSGDYIQEIKRGLRPRRTAMEELGKITKSKNVSLETKIKVIQTLLSAIIMYGCESWKVKKIERNKGWVYLKYGVGGELSRYPEPSIIQVVPSAN